MSDLWHEASADHELEAREASLARADAEMIPVYAFLFEARSARELEHRLAFAEQRLWHIAASCGMEPGELEDAARRRYALLKEALPEGVDPVAPVLQAGQGFGSGPEEGYEHEEGPDFSHGYSEIPQGPLGGPNPAVTGVPEPAMAQPQQQATAGKSSEPFGGNQAPPFGKKDKKKKRKKEAMSRTAAGLGDMALSGDVNSGLAPGGSAPGARDTMFPAGAGGGQLSPDGMRAGGLPTRAQAPPAPAGSGGSAASGGYDLTPAQDITASRKPDPVRRQVEAVAASVKTSNPYLSDNECRRVARRVVGTYLTRQGDMASSAWSDEPWANQPGSGGDGGGKGGMSGLEEYGLGRQLINKLPGAGAAGELGEAAELAAL